ncbi:MAG TPA: WS/DGAT domain-containing protein [Mycobacterium sp.]|nr:WS/DGAT domain-containing protein [Mycobacterium sp.]
MSASPTSPDPRRRGTNGARAERFFGIAPIFHGMAPAFGVFSYCGRIEVTVVSCRRVVPDPGFLADCLQVSYEELLAKAQVPPAIPHRRRARA